MNMNEKKKSIKQRSSKIYNIYIERIKNANTEDRSAIKTSTTRFVEKIYNDEVLKYFFSDLTDEQLADILFHYTNTKEPIKSHWIDAIRKLEEYNFISVIKGDEVKKLEIDDEYILEIDEYISEINENISKIDENILKIDENINEIEKTKIALSNEEKFLNFIKDTSLLLCFKGNPLRWKSEIGYDHYKTDIKYTPYYDQLYKYSCLNDIEESKSYEIFISCLYDLLLNCADEIIRTINVFFDYYLFNSNLRLRKELLKDAIDKLIALNLDIVQESKTLLKDKKDIKKNEYPYHLTYGIRRMKRDVYFKSLEFLKNRHDPLPFYEIFSDNNKFTHKNAQKGVTGRDDYNEKTYRANRLFLYEYLSVLHLNDAYELNLGIPRPSIILDHSLLRHAQILYNEFIVLGNEHIDKSKHDKSKMNITISNMMKNSIQTIYSLENSKKFDKSKCIYLYNENDESELENDDIIFNQTILMTEKIRRGFYSLDERMDEYVLIYDCIIDVRSTIEYVFKLTDINSKLKMIYKYYNGVRKILNQTESICLQDCFMILFHHGLL
ncbi:hypothetical protein MKD05_17730 [[Clostridium] innocuum]|nr:hypothetical protein [[Clostridium] innocuum]